MKPSHFLLFPLGVLLGLACAHLLGSANQTGENSAPPRDHTPVPSIAVQPKNDRSLAVAPALLDPRGGAPALAVVTQDVATAVRSALASARSDLPKVEFQANGAIRGRVNTLAGTPLEGVEVRLTPLGAAAQVAGGGTFSDSRSAPPPTLAEEAQRLLQSESGALLTRSDAQGNFTLAVDQERLYAVDLQLSGWSFQRLGALGKRALAGTDLSYLATPLAGLELDLLDAGGQPLESAVLAYAQREEGRNHWELLRWSRAQPRLEFPPGTYRLIALSPEAEPWCPEPSALWLASERSSELELKLEGASDPRRERWQLLPRPTLYGQIQTSADQGRLTEGYTLALVEPGVSPPPLGIPNVTYQRYKTPNFLLIDETGGPRDLHIAWKGEDSWRLLGRADLPQGNLRRDFPATGLVAGPDWVLIAADPAGAPLESLGTLNYWTSGRPADRNLGAGVGRVLMTAPGRFELRPDALLLRQLLQVLEDADASTTAGCDVLHPVYGPQRIEFVAGQSEYRWSYKAPASLTVHLSGAPAPGAGLGYAARLALRETSPPRFGEAHWLTPQGDQGGAWEARIEGLQPGSYRVELMRSREGVSNGRGSPLMNLPVQLSSGPNDLRFDWGQLSPLRVRVPGGAGGHLSLQPRALNPFGTSQRVKINADELAVFEAVMAGEYLLNHEGQSMPVVCPSPELVFSPRAANCITVEIYEEGDQGLYGAGLRQGDRITAIDGAPFSSESWQAAISLQSAERDLRLTVMRDGVELQRTVSNRILRGGASGTLWEAYDPELAGE